MNKRPVTAKLDIWGDGVMMSKKDWSKIVRWLKRAEISVAYQTRNVSSITRKKGKRK